MQGPPSCIYPLQPLDIATEIGKIHFTVVTGTGRDSCQMVPLTLVRFPPTFFQGRSRKKLSLWEARTESRP